MAMWDRMQAHTCIYIYIYVCTVYAWIDSSNYTQKSSRLDMINVFELADGDFHVSSALEA